MGTARLLANGRGRLMLALVIALLLGGIALGVPIAIALLIASIVFFIASGIPVAIITQQMLSGSSSFVLIAVPLFIFAAELMNHGGITARILRFSNAVVGAVPGGLAQVNIFSSMIFAGISGEAVSDTAGLGGVLIPAMKKQGYSKEFSAAVTASSAVAGPIIPPSVPMVITASLAGVSVGGMFMAGALPGLLFVIGAMAITYIISIRRGFPKHGNASFSELRASFVNAFWSLLAPPLIVGSLVFGIVTPSEAGVIAVAYVFAIGFFVYRELELAMLIAIARKTIITTGAIMFILSLASVYTYVLTRLRITSAMADAFFSVTTDPVLLMLIVLFVALAAGAFLSTTPAILLLIPMLGPIVPATGLDPIHFYVLVTMTLSIGTLTPPVGLNLYLSAQLANASPERVFVAMIPYILVLITIILASIFIPGIVMYLPNLR
jgi:tripartite ATP-independent transporter DctM subunit